MATKFAVGAALALSVSMQGTLNPITLAHAQQIERYTVYCADDRIEISQWDLEQMKVRRGSDVCQFASYTSRSSAMTFAERNFGGEGASCSC